MKKSDIDLHLEYLKLKSATYDHISGLPLVYLYYKDLVKLLDKKEKIACLLVYILNGEELERKLTFESYDKLIAKIVVQINEVFRKIGLEEYKLVSASPGGEILLIFISEGSNNLNISAEFVKSIRDELMERINEIILENQIASQNMRVSVVEKVLEGSGTLRNERYLARVIDSLKIEAQKINEPKEWERVLKLKKILDERSIKIVFLPIVDVKQKRIFGYEALARGPKEKDFHEPEDLLSFAYKHGFLKELEKLCVIRAIDTFLEAKKKNKSLLDKKIFINLSPPSFSVIMSDEITQKLIENEISPQQIVVELTEKFSSISPSEGEIFSDILKRLIRNIGFEVAVDDVGTGYSTLERVAALNPSYIKYDRMLFKNVHKDPIKQELLKSVFDFSKKIGSILIVEGVDNNEDYEFAVNLGIEYMQGFLFGKPVEFK